MATLTRAEKIAHLQDLEERARREARRHLIPFTHYTFHKFDETWFHHKYYQKLNDFAEGHIRKLAVFMPPQHGKSQGSTRQTPAYLIGRNPDRKIAIACYSAAKARKFNREVQRIIDSDEYRELFPEVVLSTGSDGYARTFDEFEIPGHAGGVKTVGVGGPLTGDPVDVLIMDDLYKDWKEANSDTVRETVADWYDTVAEARLHNESQQLMVFTRWHHKDLAGRLLELEADDWEVIIYPALKVGEPTEDDPRMPGEALYPEKHNAEKLRKTKARNAHSFECVYQQNAKPKEGLLFAKEELRFYNPATFNPAALDPDKYTIIRMAYNDPADTGGDDMAMPFGYLVTGGELEPTVYITDVLYNTHGTDINGPRVIEKIIEHRLTDAWFEGNTAWRMFAKQVRSAVWLRLKTCSFKIVTAHDSKHERIYAHSSFIKMNFVFRSDYEEHAEYAKFMKVLTDYMRIQEGTGKAKHDDAPDALAGMAHYFQRRHQHLWVIK